jgi:hypothetical protein
MKHCQKHIILKEAVGELRHRKELDCAKQTWQWYVCDMEGACLTIRRKNVASARSA